MTLAPVFRSRKGIEFLLKNHYIEKMQDSIKAQKQTISRMQNLMPEIIDDAFLGKNTAKILDDVSFVQSNFFPLMFHSIYNTLGIEKENSNFYNDINFCVKGIVIAGDNIFDNEEKTLIPLSLGKGKRFRAIMQLLCFQRLLEITLEEAEKKGVISDFQKKEIHKEIITRLAEIGTLEGSEEEGIKQIMSPKESIEKVHKIRGGKLFSLAFIAPMILEGDKEKITKAAVAVEKLGTSFQIVDDITDIEFDITRRTNNILLAEIASNGRKEERDFIEKLYTGKKFENDILESPLSRSIDSVLTMASQESVEAFSILEEMGFWINPEDSKVLVKAIIGIDEKTKIRN